MTDWLPTEETIKQVSIASWLRKPCKKPVMNSNCPFDPNSFPDHFCSVWQKCEKCLRKFLQLLNLEKDNKIDCDSLLRAVGRLMNMPNLKGGLRIYPLNW